MTFRRRLSVIAAIGTAALVAVGSTYASGSKRPPSPKLIALTYGHFKPQGAPHAYLALRLTAQQPGGQIIEANYQEINTAGRPDGVGGEGDSECGIGGRKKDGGVEVSFLPVKALAAGVHHIRVTVDGSGCEPNSPLSEASRVFVLRVR